MDSKSDDMNFSLPVEFGLGDQSDAVPLSSTFDDIDIQKIQEELLQYVELDPGTAVSMVNGIYWCSMLRVHLLDLRPQ